MHVFKYKSVNMKQMLVVGNLSCHTTKRLQGQISPRGTAVHAVAVFNFYLLNADKMVFLCCSKLFCSVSSNEHSLCLFVTIFSLNTLA